VSESVRFAGDGDDRMASAMSSFTGGAVATTTIAAPPVFQIPADQGERGGVARFHIGATGPNLRRSDFILQSGRRQRTAILCWEPRPIPQPSTALHQHNAAVPLRFRAKCCGPVDDPAYQDERERRGE